MRFASALILVALLTCCSWYAGDKRDNGGKGAESFAVESFRELDPSEMNALIKKAVARGELWPRSPALLVFTIVGGDEESRFYLLSQEGNRGEDPDRMSTVLVREGFLDDSISGDRHDLTLGRERDGTWLILEIRKAYRCRRDGSDSFHAGPCP